MLVESEQAKKEEDDKYEPKFKGWLQLDVERKYAEGSSGLKIKRGLKVILYLLWIFSVGLLRQYSSVYDCRCMSKYEKPRTIWFDFAARFTTE